MNRIVESGLINLKESLENGLDISNLRNKSGMTLLHVAAASSNDYAEPIIQFVLENQLLSINEKSKVFLSFCFSCRMDGLLFIMLSPIRMNQ